MTEPCNDDSRIRACTAEPAPARRRPNWEPTPQYYSYSSVLLARAEFKERHGRYPTASELRMLGLDVREEWP